MSKKRELYPLTGIRAIAAFGVVFYHLVAGYGLISFLSLSRIESAALRLGYLGVDLFFILSGFIISYNYVEDFRRFDLSRYARFLKMRLARIYPVHLVTLFILLGLFCLAKWRNVPLNHSSDGGFSRTDFIENLLLVHHWRLHAGFSWNYPAFSISLEWLAYLCFPLIVAARIDSLPYRLRWLFCFASVCFLAAAYQAGMGDDLLRIATGFISGCLLHSVYRSASAGSPRRWYLSSLVPAALGVVLILLVGADVISISPYWIVVLFPWLLYTLALDGTDLISAFLSRRTILFWGRASYSLYMTHAIACMVLNKLAPFSRFEAYALPVRVGAVGLWIGACMLCAVLCYRFIEVPARRLLCGASASSRSVNITAAA